VALSIAEIVSRDAAVRKGAATAFTRWYCPPRQKTGAICTSILRRPGTVGFEYLTYYFCNASAKQALKDPENWRRRCGHERCGAGFDFAAGTSSRLGEQTKQLLPWRNTTMLGWVVRRGGIPSR
jgi:hypothetical protein